MRFIPSQHFLLMRTSCNHANLSLSCFRRPPRTRLQFSHRPLVFSFLDKDICRSRYRSSSVMKCPISEIHSPTESPLTFQDQSHQKECGADEWTSQGFGCSGNEADAVVPRRRRTCQNRLPHATQIEANAR